jgi:hypothetical protein
MARLHFHDMGKIGLVQDLPGYELPPEALWVGYNLRLKDNYITNFGPTRPLAGTLNHEAAQIFYVPFGEKKYWAYCGLSDVSVWDPDVDAHYNISKFATAGTSYTGTVEDQWNACWLNGVWVLNNGVDVPQYWSNGSTSTRLQNLPAWPSGYTAKVIRPFKNFLLALDVTKSGVSYPSLVLWSHPADPGSPPSSWNVADTTKLAGELQLAQTEGEIIDSLVLRESNVIYKRDSIILQQYVGGNDIFAWREVSNTVGIMGQNCTVEFEPGLHALLTSDGDVQVFNGQSLKSVATGRVLNTLKGSLSGNIAHRSYLVAYPEYKEVWVHLVDEDGGGYPYTYAAYVWNWERNTWGQTGTLGTRDSAAGVLSYDYGGENNQRLNYTIMALDSDGLGLTQLDLFVDFDTSTGDFTTVTWEALSFDGRAQYGSPRVDYNQHKVLTEIWPNVEGDSTVLEVTVTAADTAGGLFGSTNFQTFTFNVGTDTKIDCLLDGKYFQFSWTFYSLEAAMAPAFNFYGFSLEVNVAGEYP